ncbi:MAG: hypothetical protein U0790_03385 [Isosphaeraceae bacterium]
MAERVVLSWQLDRADAAEHAELARRVRDLPKGAAEPAAPPRVLRKVLADDPDPEPDGKPRPGRGPTGWPGWSPPPAAAGGGTGDTGKVSGKLTAGTSRPGGWAWDVELPMVRLLGMTDRPAAARSPCEACPHRRGAQFGSSAVDGGGGPPDGAG